MGGVAGDVRRELDAEIGRYWSGRQLDSVLSRVRGGLKREVVSGYVGRVR
jgi:hypothetical protein